MNNVADRLRGLITGYAGIAPDKITDDCHLLDDLGIDSLEKIEILMVAEVEFGIAISDEEAQDAQTFADCVTLINAH